MAHFRFCDIAALQGTDHYPGYYHVSHLLERFSMAAGGDEFAVDVDAAGGLEFFSGTIFGALGTAHGGLSGRFGSGYHHLSVRAELDYSGAFGVERLEGVVD